MPDTVLVDGNKLMVRKVDYAVNTTFTCEVKNKLGTSRHQITTIVIGESVGPTERTACTHMQKHTNTHARKRAQIHAARRDAHMYFDARTEVRHLGTTGQLFISMHTLP